MPPPSLPPPEDQPFGRRDALVDVKESLPACFERLVGRDGFRPALGSSRWSPTYSELNGTANRLAHVLRVRGGALGDRVAVLMQHDTPLIAAMLAALKAGRIVMVLNPTDPPARLRQVVDDAEPSAMVVDTAHEALAGQIAGPTCRRVSFDAHAGVAEIPNPDVRISPTETAFLVYTSGSTGSPRGVMLTHRQILRNARTHARAMDLAPGDRIALLVSLSGGLGVTVTWCALASGASLHPFPTMDKGVVGLAAWLTQHGITVYMSTASLFQNFVGALGDGALVPGVRLVRLSSEPATSEDFTAFQRRFPDAEAFVHTLGTTESGNIAHLRLHRGDVVPAGRLPIGHPAAGIEILLQDPQGRIVGAGEPGEIVIRSRYLSPGYWRDAELTAERFVDAPEGDGVRSFRTGDLARVNADGLLEFLGRRDARVKIRGFRVELSDVEHALRRLPRVERAVACVLDRPGRDSQLVAYVVPRAGDQLSPRALRRALRTLVPDHMVPSALVCVDSFPLTPHGKIDRSALLEAHPPVREEGQADKAKTETERLLVAVWAEVLDLPRVGRGDDFFDLGGDSLTAAVVAARLHDALGVEIDLATFDDHPTLAAMADVVDAMRREAGAGAARRLARVPRGTPLPLSLFQERVWKFSQAPHASDGYTTVGRYRIRGPLDPGALRDCMSHITSRHEILRTTFGTAGGRPVQIVQPPAPVPLPLLDLAGATDAESRAAALCAQEAGPAIDPATGPLLRFTLIRVRADEHWLLRVSHQLICDGWSWKIYFRELAALYEARHRGEDFPLPAFEPLQYGDYATWQRDGLRPGGPAYEETVSWWQRHLLGAPAPLELPFRRRKPRADVDPAEGVIQWGLTPDVSQRLAELGREGRATYYMVRLAAFVALLAAEIGERDVVIGAYVNARNRAALQNMIGYFVNLVTLRLRCEARTPFRRWLSDVRAALMAAGARGDVPYEELSDELRTRGGVVPEIRVIFAASTRQPILHFADLTLTPVPTPLNRMPWGLTVQVSEHDEKAGCSVAFDAGLYKPAGVRAFVARFARLLDCVSSHPDLPVGDLVAMSRDRAPGVIAT
jgi:amino acid adenylation domain-containing protein